MKLITDIDDETYNDIKKGKIYSSFRDVPLESVNAIANGIPYEPCEDAISRQAVIEKAVHTETEEGWCGYTVDVDYIKSLPSVTPQPKTGHWTERKMQENGFYLPTCSECGEAEPATRYTFLFRYCPNCGARMIEPQESEDKE